MALPSPTQAFAPSRECARIEQTDDAWRILRQDHHYLASPRHSAKKLDLRLIELLPKAAWRHSDIDESVGAG